MEITCHSTKYRVCGCGEDHEIGHEQRTFTDPAKAERYFRSIGRNDLADKIKERGNGKQDA